MRSISNRNWKTIHSLNTLLKLQLRVAKTRTFISVKIYHCKLKFYAMYLEPGALKSVDDGKSSLALKSTGEVRNSDTSAWLHKIDLGQSKYFKRRENSFHLPTLFYSILIGPDWLSIKVLTLY